MELNPIELMIENIGEIGKYATIWEFEFRMLCLGLNIESYHFQELENEDRLYSPKLNIILKKLYENYPFLDFDFIYAQTIRNAISHSNFQELADIVHKGNAKRFYTPAVGASFLKNKKNPTFLGEDLPKGKLKEAGVFGLFIRTMNKRITTEAINILTTAITVTKDLQVLKSHSFEIDYFSNFFIDGIPFTENDFQSYNKLFSNEEYTREHIKNFFDKYYYYSKLPLPRDIKV